MPVWVQPYFLENKVDDDDGGGGDSDDSDGDVMVVVTVMIVTVIKTWIAVVFAAEVGGDILLAIQPSLHLQIFIIILHIDLYFGH